MRAMDRRRFVPAGDGLEGRALLSTLGATTSAKAASTSLANLPETFKAKEERIAHLPYFLNSFQPGRYIPADTMKDIQLNLQELAGTMRNASSEVLNNFNLTLRHALPYNTLSPNTAKLLNHAFSVVLVQAGADPTHAQRLTNDMNQLAVVDSRSINPSYLARNDYSLVLQTTLAVGRPIQTPAPPVIAPKDGKSVEAGKAGYTYNHTPALVGTYTVGATADASTRIFIFNGSDVIAVGAVEKNGRYSAQVTTPLADGVYKLEARAIDQYGHISRPSRAYSLKVATKP
jgi:Bacterial Ig-like domain